MSKNTTDIIFIGKKPLMTYVTSAILHLSVLPSVTLKARGLSISSAVTIAQIILRRTNAFELGDIKIDSESLDSLDGEKKKRIHHRNSSQENWATSRELIHGNR